MSGAHCTQGAPAGLLLTSATRRMMAGEVQAGLGEVDRILGRSDLTEDVLAEAEAMRLLGVVALDDLTRARQLAEDILAGEHRCPGNAALAVALAALAQAAWDDGRVADALLLLRAAVERGAQAREGSWAVLPQLWLAAALTAIGEFDGAVDVIDDAEARIGQTSAVLWSAAPSVQRAVVHLAAGRLEDARADANMALDICAERSTGFFAAAAESVLGSVALHRGDIGAAASHVGRQELALVRTPLAARPGSSAWAAARLAEAAGDDAALSAAVDALFDHVCVRRRLFVDEPASAAWLARNLLGGPDADIAGVDGRRRAEVVVFGVEQLAATNPGVPALAAAADHARGVLEGDLGLLQRAAAGHRHPWATASAFEDAGVVLHRQGDVDDARSHLEAAQQAYHRAGADRDARRSEDRLHQLGTTPLSGWNSLTETEQEVATVVAAGLTNAEAAQRLHLSRFTIDFHLRHVFDKLVVRSRVELVPIVLRHVGRLMPSR